MRLVRRSEARVLDLLVQGMSNVAIAEALTLSVKTVEVHIHNIRERTGINNRVELAFWWRDNAGNFS